MKEYKAGRRVSCGAEPSTLSNSSKEKTRVPASDIEHRRSTAQLTLTVSPQTANGHRSQSLSRLQARDLRGYSRPSTESACAPVPLRNHAPSAAARAPSPL